MKKLLYFLLLFSLAVNFCGCAANNNQNAGTISFYYLRNNADFSATSPLLINSAYKTNDTNQDLQPIFRYYLTAPAPDNCVSPFPLGTELVSLDIESNQVSVTLTQHIKSLSAARQTIAYACITKTLIELAGVESVQIIITGSDTDSQTIYNFTNDSFTYSDSFTISDLETP